MISCWNGLVLLGVGWGWGGFRLTLLSCGDGTMVTAAVDDVLPPMTSNESSDSLLMESLSLILLVFLLVLVFLLLVELLIVDC